MCIYIQYCDLVIISSLSLQCCQQTADNQSEAFENRAFFVAGMAILAVKCQQFNVRNLGMQSSRYSTTAMLETQR